jgi:NADH-quinone oxidoreductase subunit E
VKNNGGGDILSCENKLCEAKQDNFSGLDKILKENDYSEGNLIAILQNAQEIYGYLSRKVIEYISAKCNIKVAQVYGVATFYTQFRFSPIGKNHILLCVGTACHVNGASLMEDAIFLELGIRDGETTEDELFTLSNVACIGCCSLSPVMMINGNTYGNLDTQNVKKIISTLSKEQEQAREVAK